MMLAVNTTGVTDKLGILENHFIIPNVVVCHHYEKAHVCQHRRQPCTPPDGELGRVAWTLLRRTVREEDLADRPKVGGPCEAYPERHRLRLRALGAHRDVPGVLQANALRAD